ncbi:hypothetical protein X975_20457, partial [Stegodyphus mimosarum]
MATASSSRLLSSSSQRAGTNFSCFRMWTKRRTQQEITFLSLHFGGE